MSTGSRFTRICRTGDFVLAVAIDCARFRLRDAQTRVKITNLICFAVVVGFAAANSDASARWHVACLARRAVLIRCADRCARMIDADFAVAAVAVLIAAIGADGHVSAGAGAGIDVNAGTDIRGACLVVIAIGGQFAAIIDWLMATFAIRTCVCRAGVPVVAIDVGTWVEQRTSRQEDKPPQATKNETDSTRKTAAVRPYDAIAAATYHVCTPLRIQGKSLPFNDPRRFDYHPNPPHRKPDRILANPPENKTAPGRESSQGRYLLIESLLHQVPPPPQPVAHAR